MISIQWHRRVLKNESDELLYTVLATRYGPQSVVKGGGILQYFCALQKLLQTTIIRISKNIL